MRSISRPGAGDARNIKVGSDRAGHSQLRSMAKLGGALFSSVGDPLTAALASQFRGNGFFRSLAQQFGNFIDGSAEGARTHVPIGRRIRRDHAQHHGSSGRRRWTAPHDRPG